ncbi:MAG TPA: SigE family RNA polymerase sigma factor [Streptosporangiaceae bacterium]
MTATDRAEFDEFMASRWPQLVRLAFGLTGDRWLAEDLAQTALASAYAAWWRVRRADDPDAYVRKILINASSRRFRRHRVTELPLEPPGPRHPAEAAQVMADPVAADPAAGIGERSDLLAALAELPPRQRAAIVLRYWEDLTDSQAAAILGCSPATVRSQVSRALAKLRTSAVLADPGPRPGGKEGAR